MIRIVQAQQCVCDKCDHEWIIPAEATPPVNCANQKCRTREWNGKKQQIRSHRNEIKFPAPRTGGRPKTITGFDYSEDL